MFRLYQEKSCKGQQELLPIERKKLDNLFTVHQEVS